MFIRGAESVGLCLRFLPSSPILRNVQRQRCCKRGSGDSMADGMGRDSVFMTTARMSDLSMPLKGEVRRSPEQSARQPLARSSKFARRAYSRRAVDCEKMTILCFFPTWSTLLFERGWGKRGDLTWQPAVKHQRPAAKTTNSNKQQPLRPRSGPSNAAHTRTTGVKEQQVVYWLQLSIEKGNQINT